MATHFQLELDKLKSIIIKIGSLAESQVNEALKSLLYEPAAQVKEVKKTEVKIDKLDVKIDQICQSIFALQQPVASDLRFIMSAMQISNEIERVGDLSISIVKKTKNIKEKHDLISKFNIDDLTKKVNLVVAKTNECFISQDENLINEVFILNKDINEVCDASIEEIIKEMKANPKVVASGTHLVIVLKHIERISGHCTNVAEYVYFMINARIIKHEKFEDKSLEL